MAVEISILSGARQGQRQVLDVTRFKAGSDPGCEVYFDPSVDPSAKDRTVLLCLMDDGWYIQCTGKGEVFVQHTPVVGLMRIRSGSVVRMSEFGPEFEFKIVSRPRGSVGKPEAPLSTVPAGESVPAVAPTAMEAHEVAPSAVPVADATPPAMRPVLPAIEVPGPSLPDLPAASRSPLEPAGMRRPRQPAVDSGRLAVWIGGGLLACLMLLVLAKLLMTPSTPTVIVMPPQPAPPGPQPGPPQGETAKPGPPGNEPPKKDTPPPPVEVKPPEPPKPSGDPVRARLEGAVLLIQVERTGHFFPYATCCALSDNTVLTSAREAYQLAAGDLRPGAGYKHWVTNPATGLKLEVQDIRLHAMFVTLGSKPGDWIYYNLALLTVRGSLPKTVELASPEELGQLNEGHAVWCFGFTHEGDKIVAEDRFDPMLISGKIFLITAQRNLPGTPSVLHVRAEIPKFAYGSPVVNRQGKLVGLYGGEAVADQSDAKASAPPLNLHYATVVSAELIDLWLKKADGKVWVSAAEPKVPAKARTPR